MNIQGLVNHLEYYILDTILHSYGNTISYFPFLSFVLLHFILFLLIGSVVLLIFGY